MSLKRRILIIGGNAAGAAAAAKAKRFNPLAEVILFEKSPFISTGTCELPYLISGEINDYRKIVFFDEHSFEAQKGVKVFSRSEVLEIDRRRKTVKVSLSGTGNLEVFAYDKLILCTGSHPGCIGNDAPRTENVFTLKSVEDFLVWQKFRETSKPSQIVIIGAGNIGLELTDALLKTGCEITVVEKNSLPLASAETEISALIAGMLQQRKVNFLKDCNDFKLIKTGDRVTAVKVEGRFLECDAVFLTTGVVPQNRLAAAAGLKTLSNGTLLVSSKLMTSDPDIFAAGDVIGYKTVINTTELISSASLAHLSGRIAGANAAGGNMYLQPVIRNQCLHIFGKTYAQAGYSSHQLTDLKYRLKSVSQTVMNKPAVMPDTSSLFSKILYDAGTSLIYGASFFGGPETKGLADIIALCIRKGIKASELDDITYNYTPALSPLVHPLEILADKIKKING